MGKAEVLAYDLSPLDPQRRSLSAILREHLPTFLRAHALPGFVREELSGWTTPVSCTASA